MHRAAAAMIAILWQPVNRRDHWFLRGDYLLAWCRRALKLDRHLLRYGVSCTRLREPMGERRRIGYVFMVPGQA
jgi:hypothetical protein